MKLLVEAVRIMPEQLISKKTLYELQEHLSGAYVLREIEQLFDSADIPLSESSHPTTSGQRRTLVARYYHSLDLSKWEDVRKLLYVFELVLSKLEEGCADFAFNQDLSWTPKTGQSNKLLLAVQKGGKDAKEKEVPQRSVQGPGGARGAEG
jgi:hypothetical protein